MRRYFFALLAVAGFAQPLVKGPKPPVILVNGYQLVCPGVPVPTSDTFGRMEELLVEQGRQVRFFDNCLQGRVSIEKLGKAFGKYLGELRYEDDTPVESVDIVAHSMGGLIVRCYLAGCQEDGSYRPPFPKRIGRLITIGSPHFGADFGVAAPDPQAAAMVPGTQFLWELATWNQYQDDLRGVDALAIVGRSRNRAGDGLVSAISASSYFVSSLPADRTRVISGCHTTGFGGIILGCNVGERGIANMTNAEHPAWLLIRGFLDGDSESLKPLSLADDDSELSANGALWISYTGNGNETAAGRDIQASLQATGEGGAPIPLTALGDSPASIVARTPLRDTTLEIKIDGQDPLAAPVTLSRGVRTIAFKTGLAIAAVESATAEDGVFAGGVKLLPSGGRLRIRGMHLDAVTAVLLDDVELELLSNSEEEGIVVAVPERDPGAALLTVLHGGEGGDRHSTRLVFGPAPSRLLTAITGETGAKIEWSPVPGATGYAVWIGTEAGKSDLFEQTLTRNLECELPQLASGDVYVRLWTLVDGIWSYREGKFQIP